MLIFAVPCAMPVPIDGLAIWLTLIDKALDRASMSQKQAAAEQGISLEVWYQQRHGLGHVSLWRLTRMPVAFWIEFLPLVADHFGLTLPTRSFLADLHALIRPHRARTTVHSPRSHWTRDPRQQRLF